MKHVFSILLLCLIFQNVLTARRSLKMRMAKAAQALKLISDAKEKKLRKLQNTDVVTDTEAGESSSGNQTETSGADSTSSADSTTAADSTATADTTSSGQGSSSNQAETSGADSTSSADTTTEASTSGAIPDTSVQTSLPVENYTDNSPEDEPESANATAENANVSSSKPVAVKPKRTGNSNAAVQVLKFHGFHAPTGSGIVTFKVYVYFNGRAIVKYIVLRLRITYRSRFRNLQETTAESARTDCVLTDPSLAGKTLSENEAKNVNYDCSANATQGDASTANFTLNTDVPMTMVNANGTAETLDFAEVNFNGEAAEESISLQVNTQTISGSYIFTATNLEFAKQVLVFTGTLSSRRRLRNLELRNGQTVQMTLVDSSNEGNKYDCTYNVASSSSTLECDTSSNPIKTTVEKLDLNVGTSTDNQTLVTLKMDDALDRSAAITTPSSSRYTYNRSSSGLSGGAIAGIVIACVVALAAASIAAIMLRKPAPPVDNTTIVDLKTETI